MIEHLRWLVVDDVIRCFTSEHLPTPSYAEFVSNVEESKARLTTVTFDVVSLDFNLGGGSTTQSLVDWLVSPSQVELFAAGKLVVNIHTGDYGNGRRIAGELATAGYTVKMFSIL